MPGAGSHQLSGLTETVAGSTLASATRKAVVAFETDDVRTRTRTRWSILVLGETYEVTDPARLAELTGARLIPCCSAQPS